MAFDRIIKGGNVVTPAGTFVGDVGITGEKISALGVNLEGDKATKVTDAKGHHVIPGVLDVHVHLELPFCGTVSADDYNTGTRAAGSQRHIGRVRGWVRGRTRGGMRDSSAVQSGRRGDAGAEKRMCMMCAADEARRST